MLLVMDLCKLELPPVAESDLGQDVTSDETDTINIYTTTTIIITDFPTITTTVTAAETTTYYTSITTYKL